MVSNIEGTGSRQSVGVLQLDEPPRKVTLPGGISAPNTFSSASTSLVVKGAIPKQVHSADPSMAPLYIQTAKTMEEEGASVITSNCGFTIVYQESVQQGVGVPVVMSSLLFLPLLGAMCGPAEQIGILTFDADKLGRVHFEAAWPACPDGLVVTAGIEGTQSWRDINTCGYYDWDQIKVESLRALERLICNHARIRFIIVECCAYCAFLPDFRRLSPVPVFDIVSLVDLTMHGKPMNLCFS